jgi:hypothetical protein
MFVELLDKLRCLNDHEDSSLVATVTRTVDRHIIEGALGCPVCHAEYRVLNSVVEFGGEARKPVGVKDALSPGKAVRLGALLGLDERGGLYVLDFAAAQFIAQLTALAPEAQFIALSGDHEVAGAGIVIRGAGSALPLAKGIARGVALDDATPGRLNSAARVLAAGGRLVAPADAIVPYGIRVLARDDEQWVGEREAVPAVASLRRAPR